METVPYRKWIVSRPTQFDVNEVKTFRIVFFSFPLNNYGNANIELYDELIRYLHSEHRL